MPFIYSVSPFEGWLELSRRMGPPTHRQKTAKSSKEQQKKRRGSPASKPGKGDPEEIKGGGGSAVKLDPAVVDYFRQAHETFKSGFASDEEKSKG